MTGGASVLAVLEKHVPEGAAMTPGIEVSGMERCWNNRISKSGSSVAEISGEESELG